MVVLFLYLTGVPVLLPGGTVVGRKLRFTKTWGGEEMLSKMITHSLDKLLCL